MASAARPFALLSRMPWFHPLWTEKHEATSLLTSAFSASRTDLGRFIHFHALFGSYRGKKDVGECYRIVSSIFSPFPLLAQDKSDQDSPPLSLSLSLVLPLFFFFLSFSFSLYLSRSLSVSEREFCLRVRWRVWPRSRCEDRLFLRESALYSLSGLGTHVK